MLNHEMYIYAYLQRPLVGGLRPPTPFVGSSMTMEAWNMHKYAYTYRYAYIWINIHEICMNMHRSSINNLLNIYRALTIYRTYLRKHRLPYDEVGWPYFRIEGCWNADRHFANPRFRSAFRQAPAPEASFPNPSVNGSMHKTESLFPHKVRGKWTVWHYMWDNLIICKIIALYVR